MEVWLAGLLDRLGEPENRVHPVAWFGGLALWLERRFYRDARGRGAALVFVLLGLAAGVGAGIGITLTALPPWLSWPLLALALKPSFALCGLLRAAREVEAALAVGLVPAREALGQLVSRATGELTAPEVRMAVIESLAENLSDALVAPLFYYLILGLPGAYLYRAANTLDAMWGYTQPRYARFGWAAARLDDFLNLVPARLTAFLLAGIGGPALWREAKKTPSPNAGWPMAALARSLGLRLEKRGVYVLHPEGRPPQAADVQRALVRVGIAGYLWIALVGAIAWGVGR